MSALLAKPISFFFAFLGYSPKIILQLGHLARQLAELLGLPQKESARIHAGYPRN